jgi:xylulokinase
MAAGDKPSDKSVLAQNNVLAQTNVPAQKYVLAIDMGSGSAKAALVSNRGEVVASGLRPIRTILLPGGGAEQDPEEWWSAVCGAANAALAQAAIAPELIIAIACTTQWAVTVPVDQDGTALSNAISWMDTRGGPYNRAVAGGFPALKGYSLSKVIKWLRLTGGAPVQSGADGLGHVLYFKHARPEIYARTRVFLEPMDYLNMRLTGRCAASYGTIFPYWLTDNRDSNNVRYVPELLRLAGVDRAKMPDLFPVNAVLGTITPRAANQIGLAPGTKVVMGSCEAHSAPIGAGAVRDYQGYFYIGTTSWLSCHVPAKKSDPLHMISTMPAGLPGRYMVTAEQGVAGRCLEFLKELLFPEGDGTAPAAPDGDVYGYLNRIAAQAPAGSDGLIFTPWINGVLAPSEDPSTRSAFFNQKSGMTRKHYVRAVMEGVAFNLRWLKRHVEKFIGRPFERLNFIGGGAQSDLWCQIQADVLGCPVSQVANPRHANAVGAALAAFTALGEVRIDQIPSLVKIAAVYDPTESNRRIYDRQFQEFMQFYKRTKSIYRRLNPVAAPR